jgi:hypothetical protein
VDEHQRETLRRHTEGVPEALVELARAGTNPFCVQCGAPTLCGGLRCYTHFKKIAPPVVLRSTGCGSEAGYNRHRKAGEEPCRACVAGATEAKRARKAAA